MGGEEGLPDLLYAEYLVLRGESEESLNVMEARLVEISRRRSEG